jgi:hypothetical protein
MFQRKHKENICTQLEYILQCLDKEYINDNIKSNDPEMICECVK